MSYQEEFQHYFPNGLHDYYLLGLEILFENETVELTTETPDAEPVRVSIKYSGVSAFEANLYFGRLEDENEVFDLVEVDRQLTLTGVKGWTLKFRFLSASVRRVT